MQTCLRILILAICSIVTISNVYEAYDYYNLIARNPDLSKKLITTARNVGIHFEKTFYRLPSLLENTDNQTSFRSCFRDFASISKSILEGETWPWQFLDASGKIPPGMSGGDLTWVGSFEMCNQIVDNQNSSGIRGRYCNMRIPVLKDDPDVAVDLGLSIGMCLPSACNTDDLRPLSERMFGTLRVEIDERYTFCYQRSEELPRDNFFIMAVVTSSVVLALVVFGSILDLVLYCKWKSLEFGRYKYLPTESEPDLQTINADSAASSTEPSSPSEPEQHGLIHLHPAMQESFVDYRGKFFDRYCLCGGFVLLFSFPYNLWKLYQSRPRETVGSDGQAQFQLFGCLDGIRVITCAWIIYVHTFTFQTYYANNMLMYREEKRKDWSFQIIRNGSFSVDTFFLISGTLACYLMIPAMRHTKGCIRKLGFWLLAIFQRFIRIAPSWFFVTILFTGFFPYMADGPLYPQYPPANEELRRCRDHWWITFLNNFFYTDGPCMLWTWYLSNDFQFSVILTPIFVLLLGLHWIVGVLFAIGLVISSMVSTFLITYMNEYGPAPLPPIAYGKLYSKPYTRWGSYAIGMLLGWLLREYPVDARKYSFRKRFLITTIASVFAAIITLALQFGLYTHLYGDRAPMSNTLASLYAAVSRPLWALSIATAIYLCAIQFSPIVNAILSFSGFSVFSKLTYCAYLVHPILVMYYQQSKKRTESFDNNYLVFTFCAIWLLSYLVAIVISLTTEVPMLFLGKMIIRRRSAQGRESRN